ncbi:hypothetical protein [Hymenobacter gummosus]|uniref:hypothetical protein n=1 Tax=Hymenobacter gummosus TaxID=1776032 RepID=UPI000F865A49|nr:hypothetical protein [Hymenobacter gummosus]
MVLRLGRPEVLDSALTLYSHLQVLHAGQLVYQDSANEYEAARRPYPTTFADGTRGATVLLEVNNRDLNLLLQLRISNGRGTVTDTLPVFITGAAQLDDDAPLELAGMLTSNEVGGDRGEYTTYNPICYYELTAAGPVFDAKLTERRIRTIYGQFLGFRFRSEPAMPASTNEAYAAELARIRKAGRSPVN